MMPENDGVLGQMKAISKEEADAFAKVRSMTDKLDNPDNMHVGLENELDRFKKLMRRLDSIQADLDLMKNHFLNNLRSSSNAPNPY